MIERYTRAEIGNVWSEENKLRKWLEVELCVLEALAYYGCIPRSVPVQVRKKVKLNTAGMKRIEEKVKHDVIAFVSSVAGQLGSEGRYLHFGLTSSDILDTALALQVQEASTVLMRGLRKLQQALRERAKSHKRTLIVGRTHGVHAEPTTWGLKLALFYAEIGRGIERLERAQTNMNFGKISGAVGTYANIEPRIETYVCKKLGLRPEPISSQIIQRDRHAEYLVIIALVGASLEKLATEIRNLQRTEILEVEEPFEAGQKGSSAMPHKRNPIACEKVVGLSRLLRGYALAALENVTLWHERDITHSSVERLIFPDATIALDHMIVVLTGVIKDLVIHKDRMLANLEKSRGMVFSQGLLLRLILKGVSRDRAYQMVQNCARKVWDNGRHLKEVALSDPQIQRYLSKTEIEKAFSYELHTRNVDTIFKRLKL